MNILVVEPGKRPYAKEISGDLDSLQQTVGGYIQAIYPFDDPFALVCEEEVLYHPEQKWNRPIKGYGVIKGTFFLCGLGEENFTDLPQDLTEKYTKFFRQAYDFVQISNHLMPIPANSLFYPLIKTQLTESVFFTGVLLCGFAGGFQNTV